MNMDMNTLLTNTHELEPAELFVTLLRLRERVTDLWHEAAQRVIVQYVPNATRLTPVTCVDYDDSGREVISVYAINIEDGSGTLMQVPHNYSIICGDWPENRSPELSEEQEARMDALESGQAGALMDWEDAGLTVLAEAHGLTLHAIREVIEAASMLATSMIRDNYFEYPITITPSRVS